ncbi:hypothetical protein A4X09_0g3691 [Tilletia walkeri]|uniref:Uncharacterized protein n=1 Tax=Tilletia walkeri TaxID=117179 RepID=A0A8X7T4Z5_9BASI|nr:hypothetical protein A4X09_0g3691 [Tilletia walkeri]
MEYTIPYDEAMPTRWRRAHNELSPPSSPAVDITAAPTRPTTTKHPTRQAPTTIAKPVQGRATKALTPPTSTETARTAAVGAGISSASGAAQDEGARDGDRSSTSSPIPRSSPTPACDTNSDVLGSRTVTPPPHNRRYQRAKRRAAAIPPPIRDTPNNPFIEGGPADLGFRGPFGADARVVAASRAGSRVQKGRTTYVFRGQRITYEDPEYNSGDSDSDSLFGPNGLQPRLLFPSQNPPSSTSRSRPSSSSARLAASLAAHERQLGSSSGSSSHARVVGSTSAPGAPAGAQRDERGIDIDTFFGPSEPIPRPPAVHNHQDQQHARSVVHADAGHLLEHCGDWSSDTSDDDDDEEEEEEHSHAHEGFEGLEQVRMEMDRLVPAAAISELPAVSGSIPMSRCDSSRSSSASSSVSSRSTRLISGAGNKRRAHPLWRPTHQHQQGGRCASGSAEAEGFASDSTGHTFGMSRVSLANESGTKRSRLAGPSYQASGSHAGVGLGLSHYEEPSDFVHGSSPAAL